MQQEAQKTAAYSRSRTLTQFFADLRGEELVSNCI